MQVDATSAQPPAVPGAAPSAASAAMMVSKGRATIARLALRVGLLAEGCKRAGMLPEGAVVPETLLSPRSEQVVNHVKQDLQAGGALAKLVPAIVSRFSAAQHALDVLESGMAAIAVTPAMLAEAQKALTFLTRFPEQLRADPVMAEVFPPPPTQQEPAAPPSAPRVATPTRPLGPLPPTTTDGTDPALYRKAKALLDYMAERMEVVRLVTQLLDPTRAMQVREISSSRGTQARMLAQRLRRYPKELAQLQEANSAFLKLKRELDLRGAFIPADELTMQMLPLLTLAEHFHRNMVFGELFPTNRMPSFG